MKPMLYFSRSLFPIADCVVSEACACTNGAPTSLKYPAADGNATALPSVSNEDRVSLIVKNQTINTVPLINHLKHHFHDHV